MQAQIEKNNLIIKITENHEAAIGQLSKQVVVMKTDIHELQEITNNLNHWHKSLLRWQALELSNLMLQATFQRY